MATAPQSPTNPTGYSSVGITTVVWGTQGLAVFQGPAGGDITGGNNGYYILTDYKQRLKKDLDYGENGSGVECRRTTIIHGQTWDLTVEDNTNMNPPVQGTQIACYDILGNGNSASYTTLAGGVNTPPLAAVRKWTATVIESEYSAAPKRPGMRTLTVENLTLVDSQAVSAGY
jgi:hypothetical protein